MSEEVEKRVVAVLEDSSRSPFGNPIPGLAQLGMAPVELDLGTRAIDLPTGQETEATIVQINEVLQADNSTFHDLYACGIQVGSHVTVVNESGTIRLTTTSGHTVELVDDLAHAIRVKED